jgi:DNA-binding transcriptional MerR regulator/effector-binding domain-containing protein
MRVRLAIGDFSRMTHRTVKALRHYHDTGLLVPAEVDGSTGYRFYEPAQVQTAQVIRRLRDLGMPLDEIKEMLQAPDVYVRNDLMIGHLRRMESQLAQTQSVVASLRSLLERPPAPIAVEHRAVDRVAAFAIVGHVAAADLDTWWDEAFRELDAALAAARVSPVGPRSPLYAPEYFVDEDGGQVIAYVPITGEVRPAGRAGMTEIPPTELAVAVHQGTFADLDRTYGALGMYVAEREIGVDGPIREHYLVSAFDTDDESRHLTEIGWPVFRTATTS